MKTMKRILLATNLAPHSDRAMERAVLLCKQFSAELSIVFASGGEPSPGSGIVPPTDIKLDILRHLRAIPGADGLEPFVYCSEHELDEAAMIYAEAWKPDLMIAGDSRQQDIVDLFFISALERLSVACEAALLVVRNKAFGPYASALVPVDFQSVSRESVEAALSIVPRGSLHLLHVCDLPLPLEQSSSTEPPGFAQEFAELLDDLPSQNRVIGQSVCIGSPLQKIAETALAERPELIVMGTVGRSGFERLLFGSVAHSALDAVSCDVLLVRGA